MSVAGVYRIARFLPVSAQIALRRGRALLRRSVATVNGPKVAGVPAPAPARRAVTAVHLLVGPANFAGQGWAWGRAVEREFPSVTCEVFALDRGAGYAFPTDASVDVATYRSVAWGLDRERFVKENFTHVLIEAERPVLGTVYADCLQEAKVLAKAGLTVAMVSHGSDVRVPSRHVERYPYSPFKDPDWDMVPKLESQARWLGRLINEHGGPTFVSTPDLLDDVPRATWLPTVVEVDRWACDTTPLERERPLVVHAPSNTRLKGTELIEPVVQRLADAGLIEYRRISDVPNAEMPALLAAADVVLDQFVLGIYSVVACEAMAAGRVVVAHVAPHVRAHVRERSGQNVPVVEATVDTLAEVLERLCAEREEARAEAARGLEFVRRVHDGRLSARVLAPFLGNPEPGRR